MFFCFLDVCHEKMCVGSYLRFVMGEVEDMCLLMVIAVLVYGWRVVDVGNLCIFIREQIILYYNFLTAVSIMFVALM